MGDRGSTERLTEGSTEALTEELTGASAGARAGEARARRGESLPLFEEAVVPVSRPPPAPSQPTPSDRHLRAAKRLSRSIRRTRGDAAAEQRTGALILRHLRAMLHSAGGGQERRRLH